jgi:hypothetical protein
VCQPFDAILPCIESAATHRTRARERRRKGPMTHRISKLTLIVAMLVTLLLINASVVLAGHRACC